LETIIEITAVIFGLAYIYFLIKEKIICWLFGIISSMLSIFLFYKTNLYSEAILYIYYVVIGVYGFWLWNKKTDSKSQLQITELPVSNYVVLIIIGEVLAMVTGYVFSHYTDASSPYLDAHTTIFSFIASYLEAKKHLASWKFWIIINAVTIVLYLTKGLHYYTLLTGVYLVFSFVGYRTWRSKMRLLKL
jgi:nicotinamide mononucleotide transporter